MAEYILRPPTQEGGDGFILKAPEPAGPATEDQQFRASKGARAVQGVRDVIDAGAQLVTKALPRGVVDAVNRGTDAVNRMPYIGPATVALGITPSTPEQIDEGIRSNEATYQAARQATAPATMESLVTGRRDPGIDWARLGGNVAVTAPLAPAGGTGGMLAQAAKAAPVGAAFAAGSQPVLNGDFWTEKGKQAALGAATAGLAVPVLEGVARVVRPNTSDAVKLLMQEGVTPTPGQILGGTAQKIESKLTSVPIVGDAIASAQRRGIDEFNRAAYARAVNPVGGDVPKEVGREGVEMVKSTLGKAYDDLLARMGFTADDVFVSEMSSLRKMVQGLPRREAREFDNIINREITERLTSSGKGSGETLKEIESQLTKEAKRFAGSTDAYQQKLGNAIEAARQAFRGGIERSNPELAGELSKANTGYAYYARIRDAASRQGTTDGTFTPAQFSAAVRAGDKSAGKGAFATGNAFGQDLSDAGKAVLSQAYPDSGTAGRAMLGAAAAGGAYWLNPIALPMVAAASAPYLPGLNKATAAALTQRPEIAGRIADLLRGLPPAAAAPLIGSLLQGEK